MAAKCSKRLRDDNECTAVGVREQILGQNCDGRAASKTEAAMRFLITFLSSGKRLRAEVEGAGQKLGFSEHLLKRAAGKLGLDRTERTATVPPQTYWKLPAELPATLS